MEDFIMPTPEEMEASRLQMCQQGAGGPGAKPEDGKIVTRRTAAKYKQQRSAKGTKGRVTILVGGRTGGILSAAQRKANHFAKKAAGLAKVAKGYIHRKLSRGKASKLPALPAATPVSTKKSTGGRKKPKGGGAEDWTGADAAARAERIAAAGRRKS
jgi:hypothetical protein